METKKSSWFMAGDSQSVTALADLAKHAQIFNLQNWLHSGNDLPGLSLPYSSNWAN